MACCESIIDLTQLNDSISQHVALDRQIESIYQRWQDSSQLYRRDGDECV